MQMDTKEYLTIVKATINVEIHSDRPLTEEEVQDMMSEASYEIGGTFGDVRASSLLWTITR